MAPWIFKIGGAVAESPVQLAELSKGLWKLSETGQSWVLVHGGGKAITRHLAWLGEEAVFIKGLRRTSEEAMAIVEMTLSGLINKQLVRLLQEANSQNAHRVLGLSGIDLDLLHCTELDPAMGRVGKITHVHATSLQQLLHAGFCPVLSPVSKGKNGEAYNVNADEAAGALAAALSAGKLIYISDVPGVLDAEKKVIAKLTPNIARDLENAGVISGGMIPKVQNSFAQLNQGIGQVLVGDWPGISVFEKFLLTGKGWGTAFEKDL